MEEEIDIRPYIEAIISKWYWIVGAAVLAGVVAFIVSSALPPTYQATALVSVTKPSEVIEFDTRIRSLEGVQPLKAYPEIAKSDDLMRTLLLQVSALTPEIDSVGELRSKLTAETGADPTLLRLKATFSDPAQTAEIVNLWADLFVIRANQFYGNQSGDQLRFYEQQVKAATVELDKAEQALGTFQVGNRGLVLENQLLSLLQSQTDYLTEQRQIILVKHDVEALRNQLAQQPNNMDITFADQLVSISLQAKAFGVEAIMPVQFQLQSTEALVNSDRAEQLVFLDSLLETLTARATQVEGTLADMEPQILAVQAEKQGFDTQNNQVQRNFTLAEETYTVLTRKVEEERIKSQDANSGVKLVSHGSKPIKPMSKGRVLIAVVMMIFVACVTTAVILFSTWWHSLKED